MTYDIQELLRARLVKALVQKTKYPDFAAPSIERIKEADQTCWELLGDICEKGIRAGTSASGKLPLDEALPDVLKAHEFVEKLLPVRRSGKSKKGKKAKKASSSSSSSSSSPVNKKKAKRLRRKERNAKVAKTEQELANVRSQLKQMQTHKQSDKGKGKGKGGKSSFLPRDL